MNPRAVALCLAGVLAAGAHEKKIYPERWVYVSRSLREDRHVEDIRGIAETAARHGLTAILLAGGADRMSLQPPEYFERLKRVRDIAAGHKLELIPAGFNTGYGGSLLAHDRNLAEGMPVRGALYVAGEGEARFTPDGAPELLNGGFEDGVSGFTVTGAGAADTAAVREGKGSLRLEASASGAGARIEQTVKVKPYRQYRLRFWLRSAGAEPAPGFSVRAVARGQRNLCYFEPRVPPSPEWREYAAGFNSWYADEVRLSAGLGGRRTGTLWIDGMRLEEVGLVNVIRREATPLVVRNEKTGQVYAEGADYGRVTDPLMDFRYDHDGPPITLPSGSRIRPGDRLRVDYFHGFTIYRDQVSACPSDPRIFEAWAKQIPLIEKHWQPKRYFLNFDEVRVAGHCDSCKRRMKTESMAQILAGTVTAVYKMIRAANPKAQVFVWSDMFDPNHNSRPNYYLVEGDFTGSWKYLPKDMRIACWYFARREKSLEHFSGLGFKTLAAAYYDADDLDNVAGWLDALDRTPGAMGIMYTTWENKYQLLPGYGDMVARR